MRTQSKRFEAKQHLRPFETLDVLERIGANRVQFLQSHTCFFQHAHATNQNNRLVATTPCTLSTDNSKQKKKVSQTNFAPLHSCHISARIPFGIPARNRTRNRSVFFFFFFFFFFLKKKSLDKKNSKVTNLEHCKSSSHFVEILFPALC